MADFQQVDVIADLPPAEAPKEPVEQVTEATETETPAEGQTEEAEAPEGQEEAAEAAAEAAGIDMAAAEAAFMETGEVPADVYEKVAALGITKEMVDEFVGFRVGRADAIRTEMLAPFGGDEGVAKLTEWASKNWSQEQADAFNEAMATGKPKQADFALRALKADYDKANPAPKPTPKMLKGTADAGGPTGTYASLQELARDQADPRYATDASYRAGVIAKLTRSGL